MSLGWNCLLDVMSLAFDLYVIVLKMCMLLSCNEVSLLANRDTAVGVVFNMSNLLFLENTMFSVMMIIFYLLLQQ